MKRQSLRYRLLCVLSLVPAAALLFVIFCFSNQNGESSGSLSAEISTAIVTSGDKILNLQLTEEEIITSSDSIHLLVRKAAHMTEYFLLLLCLFLPISLFFSKERFSFRRRLLLSFSLCLLFASFDELHQTMIPGRSGNGLDVSIDLIGSLAACLLIYLFFSRKSSKKASRKPAGH